MRSLSGPLWLVLAGCMTAQDEAVPVQLATVEDVRGCTFVADLQRTTLRDSGSPAADLQRATDALLSAARQRGVTHLVAGERRMSYLTVSATGQAYRCHRPP